MARSIESLRTRLDELQAAREKASGDVARGEGALEQAKAQLQKLGPSSVKEARATLADLDSDIAQRRESLDKSVSEVESRLENALNGEADETD